ncbi:hypothetical protein ACH5RR_037030 [Cinchona calisaya]|uniref:Uncharacterized protein n=1 Tax=Cinchona calisaya TaxID=153742 RepID=A0ABD2Y4Y0_9GENT
MGFERSEKLAEGVSKRTRSEPIGKCFVQYQAVKLLVNLTEAGSYDEPSSVVERCVDRWIEVSGGILAVSVIPPIDRTRWLQRHCRRL